MVMVVDVPVNRSDKLQQFTFVMGANCAENRRVLTGAVRRNAWVDSGYMSTTVLGCLLGVLSHFLREGGTSDPEVDCVLLSGVAWYGECVFSEVGARGKLFHF